MKRCAIVILGATGDLARRKLLPGLKKLYNNKQLPSDCTLIASGRNFMTTDDFKRHAKLSSDYPIDITYHAGINGLHELLKCKGSFSRIIFFCALPPSAYVTTARQIKAEGFGKEAILIIEKPFGINAASARELNDALVKEFPEEQIFRIDHYLAKEAVRNLLTLRFANPLFSDIWNSSEIDSIQISSLETLGVESRAAYFDNSGIIRDMVQNHLFQMLSLTAMEPPENLNAETIRASKINLLRSLKVERCICGQYSGYKNEPGIRSGSTTETYAELELSINNPRFKGCPVYIRAAKGCSKSGTDIGITFRPINKGPFASKKDLPANFIIVKIQPQAGIILGLATRVPGSDEIIESTAMNLCYHDAFKHEWPDAYEKLLLDAVSGDRTLFVGAEETETAWTILDDVLDKGYSFEYPFGTTPESKLGAKWIEFSEYCTL
ncbi:MAG: glucose-6-phosphate dehydrogenase (NADP(+)) [Fibrobacteres bacterium]|nr:glucose-6-phosphate dehydrogenase (NADP(+)) [Fibrobacterota bacterium]